MRTESWTAGGPDWKGAHVQQEKVELFLLATENGMGPTAAAEFAGVSVGEARSGRRGTSRAATPAGL